MGLTTMESDQPTRIAFFGTPAYAVPTLRALAADPRFEVRAVITHPIARPVAAMACRCLP